MTSATQQETISALAGTKLGVSTFSGTASASATNAFTVTLEDVYGNATTNASATTVNLTSNSTGIHEFAATSGGAAVTSVTLPANTAAVTAYYGDETAGTPTITATNGTISGTATVTITAKTTGDTLSLVSGSGQSATVGTAFTNTLVVKDVDQYGNSVPGVTVTFTPPTTGASGTFTTSATAVTGSNGQATSNTYTANTTAGGPYNVVASAPGATPTINFSMTNLVGAAHTVTATSGTSQSATVGTAFTNKLVATVTDQYGNPVSGVTVTFTPPTTGASGTFTTSATAVTGSNGQATSNTYTANTTAGGPYNVAASATGASSASFPETNLAGAAHTVTATSGSGPERDRQHGLHQPAGGHGHRPVRQPRLGRDGHLHAPGQRRLGHLHHLGHRGDQRQRCGDLEHLHGQHDRRDLQRGGLGHRRHLGELLRDQHR